MTTNTKNLETYSVVWLGHDIYGDGETNVPERQQIRTVINHLKTFKNLEECVTYIDGAIEDRIILIVSGVLARPVLMRLHTVEHLSSVYIYCLSKDSYKNLLDEFSKIRGIYVDTKSLVASLVNEHVDLQRLCNNDLTIAFFSKKTKANLDENRSMLTKHNGFFVWFQVIIERLLRMADESSGEGIRTLASIYRAYFYGNDIQLKTVNEFEETYEADFAVWWYSKESFFFASLNKALRVFDIDTILAYRVFVRDIYSQLRESFEDQQERGQLWDNNGNLSVYRGQAISSDVLEQIRINKGELISFTNFVSTSRIRETGIFYMESTQAHSLGLMPVLYEICIPMRQPAKPFADVSQYSQFPEEREVLFMIGTIFRIDMVTVQKEKELEFTVVHLTLMAENDYDLDDVVKYMKAAGINGSYLSQLADLAQILEDMSEYTKAEIYYRRLLNEVPEKSLERAVCFCGLGTIALRNCKYTEAIDYQNQALKLYENCNESLDLLSLAKGHNNLGIAYGANGDMTIARHHFQRSNELKYQLSHNYQDLQMAATFDNIANTYELEDDFDQAEENLHTALAIRIANNVPCRHPDFVKTYMSLGNVYGSKKMFKQALYYHEKALNLACDVYPLDHPLRGICYNNLGEDYAYMCKHAQAKFYYHKAILIYEQTFDNDHQEIQRTRDNIKKMDEALALGCTSNSIVSIVIGILASLLLPTMTYYWCR